MGDNIIIIISLDRYRYIVMIIPVQWDRVPGGHVCAHG
jgi:hypothetical protein